MQISPLTRDDIGRLEQIEQSVPSSWSRQLINSEMQQPNGIQLVAFSKNKDNIIGWCCARMILPEIELLKLTAMTHFRRSGTASLLLYHLLDQCRTAGCDRLYLEVRQQNRPARCFYKKYGFSELGRRNRYYNNPIDNGVILKKIW